MAPAYLKGRLGKNADVSKNSINILSLYKHFKKPHILKWNVFFIAKYIPSRVFRGFEQLSSLIWRRVIAWDEIPLRVSFEGTKFWSIFGLWAIIFAPDMLESQSMVL